MSILMVFLNIWVIFIDMNTGVYRIRNLINSKFYIGSTSWDFKKRWRTHRNQLLKNRHDNPHLQYSWNKHGEANFKFEVVELCDKSICFQREQHYIDTLHPQYNILPNAGTVRGYKHTAASKALIGAASAGVNHPAYTGNHRFYHPEYGVFESSLVNFWKTLRLTKSIAYKLRLGALDKSHGWIYLGKEEDSIPKDLTTFYNNRIFNDKPPHQFKHSNGEIFYGPMSEFIQKYNLDRSVISKLVRGKRAYAYGWTIKTWLFVEVMILFQYEWRNSNIRPCG